MNAKILTAEFQRQLEGAKQHFGPDVLVFEDCIDQKGAHPEDYRNFETGFAAAAIDRRVAPGARMLDIGSNRLFIAGLSARQRITTVDVRPRAFKCTNEELLSADSKKLPLPDSSFDAVVSLNAIEHFGLGRYGEELDLDGDRKAFAEWRRVLRPGGHIIFSTTVNSAGPAVAFNAHRVYSLAQIHALCAGFTPVEEAFFSHHFGACATLADLKSTPGKWDLYAGVWQRPA